MSRKYKKLSKHKKNKSKNKKINQPTNGGTEVKSSDIVPGLIESNSPNEEVITKMISVIAEKHSGPVPHPRLLAQYKEVMEDAPERIFAMAEKQQEHRINLEKSVIHGDVKRADMGLWFGFILFLSFAGGSVYLLAIGKSIEGYVTLGVSLLGGITNFIRVGRERAKSLDQKNDKAKQKKK